MKTLFTILKHRATETCKAPHLRVLWASVFHIFGQQTPERDYTSEDESNWRPLHLARLQLVNCALVTALCCLVTCPVAGEEKAKTLDQQLFEDLQDDLFSDLAPKQQPKSKAQETKDPNNIDVELQRELGGEDLGNPRATNPLEGIAEDMRAVRDRLAEKNATVQTQQMQSRIVRRFDELIAQLKRQNQQKSGKGSQQKSPKPGAQQQAGKKPGQGQPNTQSNLPASDSTTRLGQAEPAAKTAGQRAQLMQQAWGNLPAAQQRQMQSARPEKFLPKYSRLIEEYYKRLAEDAER